jgi:hypothetical protein
MNDLKYITQLVKAILKEDPKARNSDSYLYLLILRIFAERQGINLDEIKIPYFLLNMKELGLPAFESVRRTRQKVQEHFPELASAKKIAEKRAEKEAEHREYARSALNG